MLCFELRQLLGRNIPGLIPGKNIRDLRMNTPCLYEVKCFCDFKNMELFFPYESPQPSYTFIQVLFLFLLLSQFSDRMTNHFVECTYLIFLRLVFHLLKKLSCFCSANRFSVLIEMHGVLPCMLLNNSWFLYLFSIYLHVCRTPLRVCSSISVARIWAAPLSAAYQQDLAVLGVTAAWSWLPLDSDLSWSCRALSFRDEVQLETGRSSSRCFSPARSCL